MIGGTKRRLLFSWSEQTSALSSQYLQLQYSIRVGLSIFLSLVTSGKWEFPSFESCCPICNGKRCAVRHGFYLRSVILEGGTIWILVVRYKCRRKGNAKAGTHRTFSLLPEEVHPYKRYGSCASYTILKESLVSSLTKTLDRFAQSFEKLCVSTIYQIRRVFEQAGMRLRMHEHLPEPRGELLKEVVECIEAWWNGLVGCKKDFYDRHAMFLLGTPSQNR